VSTGLFCHHYYFKSLGGSFNSFFQVYTATQDGSIFVLDTSIPKIIATLWAHTRPVNSLKALAGSRLASGSVDATIRVWDTSNGANLLITILTNTQLLAVRIMETLANGQRLANSLSNGYIQFWNMTTYKLDSQITSTYLSLINALKLLPNGNLLSLDSTNLVRIWNPYNYSLVSSFTILNAYNSIKSLQVLNDGTLVALVNQYYGGLLSFWNSSNGTMLSSSFVTFEQAIFSSVNIADDLVAVGGSSGYLEFLQIAENRSAIRARSGPVPTGLNDSLNMVAYNGQSLALEYGYLNGFIDLIGQNFTKTKLRSFYLTIFCIDYQGIDQMTSLYASS
jgi:WD40 repeat protein